ncbi:MAG: metallophosphoesterase [Anaerolineae bacterium]|nr:metallophosphoesterase [Anaerolineae bacterium]
MRLAWMTDIHLNFLGTQQIETFLDSILEEKPDALLITGDIGEANSVEDYLKRMAEHVQCPIYFVLGNHDYYHGSIEGVRTRIRRLGRSHPLLCWLPDCGVVRLTEDVALVGHGGWSDGGYGDFMKSSISLNDYLLIGELARKKPYRRALLTMLRALGMEAASHLQDALDEALREVPHVIVALHSPPFMEACWHEGQSATKDNPYLPHFTCKACGDVLLAAANKYPQRKITVLCGHTHGGGSVQIRPNLHVTTGAAVYEQPRIQQVLTL